MHSVASSEQLSEDDEAEKQTEEKQTEEKEDDESIDDFEQIEEEPLLFSDGSSGTEYHDSQTETETENELEEDDTGNLQTKRYHIPRSLFSFRVRINSTHIAKLFCIFFFFLQSLRPW